MKTKNLILVIVFLMFIEGIAFGGETRLISKSSNGTLGNSNSYSSQLPSISEDGRFVTFGSAASNLVSGDTNNVEDVFVYDGQTGITERVSVSSDGTQADLLSGGPTISADGRFVVYSSEATNLTPDDKNNNIDVFIYDRQTQKTERVSVTYDGTRTLGSSHRSSISADGRFVAFDSLANNIVLGDTNLYSDIFVLDRQLGITELVSVSSDALQSNGINMCPSISADGRFVAFVSSATNLDPNDADVAEINTYTALDIFVHDRETGITNRESVSNNGIDGNEMSHFPTISSDGRYIAFESKANNLVPGDTNNESDIFVRDRQTGIIKRISVSSTGIQAKGGSCGSNCASISANGRFVTFYSNASTLVSGDINGAPDIFVHDIQSGITQLVSVSSSGNLGNKTSFYASSISSDGNFITFSSLANNLVPGDTNGTYDVFIHEMDISYRLNVILNKTILSLKKGTSETLSVNVLPSDAANKTVNWSSSNTSVATVDSNGNVTAIGAGTCNIYVTTVEPGLTAVCNVTVVIPVSEVVLNKSSLSINKGSFETLIATVLPNEATNQSVIWSSSNAAIATVDNNGKVTAISGGICNITVTTVDGSKTGVCSVIVSIPVVYVTINQDAAQSDPANTSPVVFKIAFSTPVSGFLSNDLIISGTAGATTKVLSGGTDFMNYTVSVSGMTQEGTVIASIPANAAWSKINSTIKTAASISIDNTVTYTTDSIVRGTIDLQDYEGIKLGLPVVVTITDASEISETKTVILDADSGYAVTTKLSGICTVNVKGTHWLSASKSATIADSGSAINFSLINGDCNGDNGVDEGDFGILSTAWYSSVSDAKFDVRADLNGDGTVDEGDFGILSTAWYLSGE